MRIATRGGFQIRNVHFVSTTSSKAILHVTASSLIGLIGPWVGPDRLDIESSQAQLLGSIWLEIEPENIGPGLG